MATYADYFVPGPTLLTCETVNRENVLDSDGKIRLLRTVLNNVRQRHAFRMIAYVFLRNQLHLLLAPGEGVTLDQIVHDMMRRFEGDYAALLGMPQMARVWRRTYAAHKANDVDDFAAMLDYVHYSPVQNGLAQRPEEWLHSSYETWVERGLYELGWGWQEPESVKGRRWG